LIISENIEVLLDLLTIVENNIWNPELVWININLADAIPFFRVPG